MGCLKVAIYPACRASFFSGHLPARTGSLVDDGDSDRDPADDIYPSDQDEIRDDTICSEDIPHAPPPPPQVPAAPQAPSPPVDILNFLHKTSSYDLRTQFQYTETLPRIPVHVPSERAGGEARRTILKARAAKIPRSVSEAFAFSKSRTISDEDTAAVLETFGNVRYDIF